MYIIKEEYITEYSDALILMRDKKKKNQKQSKQNKEKTKTTTTTPMFYNKNGVNSFNAYEQLTITFSTQDIPKKEQLR